MKNEKTQKNEKKQQQETQTETAAKRPVTREVWLVETTVSGRSRWLRIGSANEGKSGSLIVRISKTPQSGDTFVIHPATPTPPEQQPQ